ncbi:unnamed protein product, partial [Didymodactylos carnosus]
NECINITLDGSVFNISEKNLNLCILPEFVGEIKNIGIWRYALSEKYIRRLFTYGLNYVAIDYQRLQQHKRQENTFIFKQAQFSRELLLFTETFDTKIWENKVKHVDIDEYKYFKTLSTNSEYAIQLFGNNSYLVLDKSVIDENSYEDGKNERKFIDKAPSPWTEYTIIMDIKVPSLPTTTVATDNDENKESTETITQIRKESISSINTDVNFLQLDDNFLITESKPVSDILTLVRISEQYAIYVTKEGKFSVSGIESESTLKLNEYVRVVICKNHNNIQIYVNGRLELNVDVDKQTYELNEQWIYLFKETNISNSTTVDIVRIECKSITFKNKSLDQL